jgi:hypothetical protein
VRTEERPAELVGLTLSAFSISFRRAASTEGAWWWSNCTLTSGCTTSRTIGSFAAPAWTCAICSRLAVEYRRDQRGSWVAATDEFLREKAYSWGL